jgi:LuxR family glucitol operon transcriptional activator
MSKITEVRLTLAAFVYSIELDLRSIIQSEIIPYISDLNFFGDKLLVERTIGRFKKDNPGLDTDDNLYTVVEYIDFSDTFTILLKNKPFLNESVYNIIKQLKSKLDEIVPIRNRVMHTRPLLGGDFSTVYAFICEITIGNSEIWKNTIQTKRKIEEDPNYVLSLSIPSITINTEEVYHNLPLPDFDETGFIGRQKDVEDIKKILLSNNRVISIIGDGGIGKTALILKVAYDLVDLGKDCPFDIIIWTSAKATMLTSQGINEIKDSLKDFSGLVNSISEVVDNSIKNSENQFEEILEYLSVFNVLLIIDNLETIHSEEIRNFIREAQQKCKIAITSRIGLGELEYPRVLNGLNEIESTKLIREFSRMRNNSVLLGLDQCTLASISKKLYYNPLAIKWFVSSVELGSTPNQVLNNKDDLLNFCLTNVYDKISPESKLIIRTLLAARKNLSDAELVFLTELSALECRKAIIDLCKTTLIGREILKNRDSQEISYFIPDFARDFLLRIETIDKYLIKKINEKLRILNKKLSDIQHTNELNEFSINSITYRNTNEQVVAKFLSEALALSKKGDCQKALQKIEEAKKIVPNYFEVYRISAFIKVILDDYIGADEDYKVGLDIEPENPRLLYYYAHFLLYNIGDSTSAIELADKLVTLRPLNPYTSFLLARCYYIELNFSIAIKIVSELLTNDKVILTEKDKKIAYTDLISFYEGWAKDKIKSERNYNEAKVYFIKCIEIFEITTQQNLCDHKTIKNFVASLVQFISLVPLCYNQDSVDLILATIKKHKAFLSLATQFDMVYHRLRQNYEIDIKGVASNCKKKKGFLSKCESDRTFCFIESENSRFFAHRDNFLSMQDWTDRKDNLICLFVPAENDRGLNAKEIELKK